MGKTSFNQPKYMIGFASDSKYVHETWSLGQAQPHGLWQTVQVE